MKRLLWVVLIVMVSSQVHADWRLAGTKGESAWDGGYLRYEANSLRTVGSLQRQHIIRLDQRLGGEWTLRMSFSRAKQTILESANHDKTTHWHYALQPVLRLRPGLAVGLGAEAQGSSKTEPSGGQPFSVTEGWSVYLSTEFGQKRDLSHWQWKLMSEQVSEPQAIESPARFRQTGLQLAYFVRF